MTQDIFQVVIRAYLDARAKADPLFAEAMKKPDMPQDWYSSYGDIEDIFWNID